MIDQKMNLSANPWNLLLKWHPFMEITHVRAPCSTRGSQIGLIQMQAL